MSCLTTKKEHVVGEFVKAAVKSEIAPGSGKKAEAGGREIALFHVDSCFYAIDDTCPHRGGPLSEGTVQQKMVTCPWHGWEFDLTSRACKTNPSAKQRTYSVQVRGDDVLVSV